MPPKRKLAGGSKFTDFVKKAGKFAKDNKVVSRGLRAASKYAGKHGDTVNNMANFADTQGYGR